LQGRFWRVVAKLANREKRQEKLITLLMLLLFLELEMIDLIDG